MTSRNRTRSTLTQTITESQLSQSTCNQSTTLRRHAHLPSLTASNESNVIRTSNPTGKTYDVQFAFNSIAPQGTQHQTKRTITLCNHVQSTRTQSITNRNSHRAPATNPSHRDAAHTGPRSAPRYTRQLMPLPDLQSVLGSVYLRIRCWLLN
ncbi:hypothetical protein E2C01_061979 [Portunus trituberculatus]|uniref:Uncharacterized protein n=1 Tax=Portunus trituberculatus TaxID=210409 RepID=A0A5B7HDV5_PORTR|nr:hypothetical protein [Portunus trituberculatus]